MTKPRLANGWASCTLSDVATRVVDGSHNPPPKSTDGGVMISARNITPSGLDLTTVRRIDSRAFESEDQRTQIRQGDVLVTIVGTLGRSIVVPADSPPLTAQRSVAVVKQRSIDARFLSAQIRSPHLQDWIESQASGTAQQGVYLGTLARLPLSIPPLNEQRRIVAKLEALQERTRNAREALEAIPPLIEKFRQSILAAAFRGDLTEHWRAKNRDVEPASLLLDRIRTERRKKWEEAELTKLKARGKTPTDDRWKSKYESPAPVDPTDLPELPEGWEWTTLSSIAWDAGYGTSEKCDYELPGPAVLRIPNVVAGELDYTDIKRSANTEYDEEHLVAPGDLLIVRTNGSKELIGRAAAVTDSPEEPSLFASYLIRYRLVGGTAIFRWVGLLFHSPEIRRALESMAATSAGQYNVSVGKLDQLAVPLPPAREINAILKIAETSLNSVGSPEAAVNASLEQLAQLESSILAKAFRGELVPQDPNDEPASVLLDRIRAEREQQQPQASRGRRTRRSMTS